MKSSLSYAWSSIISAATALSSIKNAVHVQSFVFSGEGKILGHDGDIVSDNRGCEGVGEGEGKWKNTPTTLRLRDGNVQLDAQWHITILR